jgi:T cell receptor alpha chain V region
MQLEHSLLALSVLEGIRPSLNCSFFTIVGSVQWFQQNPHGGLICLFSLTSETKQNGRLNSTINSKERYSSLHISSSQLKDSDSFLCAAKTQYSQAACSLVPNCSCATATASSLGGITAECASCGFPDLCCVPYISANIRHFRTVTYLAL